MEQCLSTLVRILLLNYCKVECIEPIEHKFHPSATSCQLIDLKKLDNISTAMTIKKVLSSDPMFGRLWIQYWKDVVKSQEEVHCIDEQIIPTKGHSSIKQYLLNKPNKWGILMCGRGAVLVM